MRVHATCPLACTLLSMRCKAEQHAAVAYSMGHNSPSAAAALPRLLLHVAAGARVLHSLSRATRGVTRRCRTARITDAHRAHRDAGGHLLDVRANPSDIPHEGVAVCAGILRESNAAPALRCDRVHEGVRCGPVSYVPQPGAPGAAG